MGKKFIDISSYQAGINLNAVKQAGYTGVIIKATENTNYINPYMTGWADKAKTLDMDFGFYHFFRGNGKAEADYFCDTIKPYLKTMNIKPVLDVETYYNDLNNQCLTFIKRVKERLGLDCIIYSYSSFSGNYLTDKALLTYPVWMAHYGVNYPTLNGIWKYAKLAAHQFSDSTPVAGYNVDADTILNEDYFYIDNNIDTTTNDIYKAKMETKCFVPKTKIYYFKTGNVESKSYGSINAGVKIVYDMYCYGEDKQWISWAVNGVRYYTPYRDNSPKKYYGNIYEITEDITSYKAEQKTFIPSRDLAYYTMGSVYSGDVGRKAKGVKLNYDRFCYGKEYYWISWAVDGVRYYIPYKNKNTKEYFGTIK